MRTSVAIRRIALVLLIGSVSACLFAEKDSDPTYRLVSGSYEGSWESVVSNTCFPDGVPVPRYVPAFTEAWVTGTALTLQPVVYAFPTAIVLPSMLGTSEDVFSAAGAAVATFSTACELTVSTLVEGERVSKGRTEFVFTIAFAAATTTTSDCSMFAGESVNNLPFPALSPTANGSCSLAVEGEADGPFEF